MILPTPLAPFSRIKNVVESVTIDGSWDTLVLPTGHQDILPLYNEFTLSENRTLSPGTHLFTNDYDINTGIRNLNKNWIAVYNASGHQVTFFMFMYRPTQLQYTVDALSKISQLAIFPGNGSIYYGQNTYSDLTKDSNSDNIPDFLGNDDPLIYDNYFITRKGNQLQRNGVNWRFAGANAHWLGTLNGGIFPTHYEVDDAMDTAVEMGMNVIRCHTLGISTGHTYSLKPTLDEWNESAFEPIDYAIYSAKKRQIRLIIPLTDEYHFYTGGKHNFTDWRGVAESEFYTNTIVIQDFKNYISHVLSHVNQYTGIAYKDDPAILAWETGNELGMSTEWTSLHEDWTQDIAIFIKSIAPNHLVVDGHTGNSNANYQLSAGQLSNTAIDMLTDHYYPILNTRWQTNSALSAASNKVYFVGEFDWTDQSFGAVTGTIAQDILSTGDYCAKVTVTQSAYSYDRAWLMQLNSNKLNLESSIQYTISFDAKSSNNNIIRIIIQLYNSPYTIYFDTKIVLSSEIVHYSYTFTPTTTLSDVVFKYNLAATSGDIWINNVSFSDGTTNLIINSTFDTTGEGWLSPWTFNITTLPGNLISTFYPLAENDTNVGGTLFWNLFGHNKNTGYNSNDMYTFHYPGDTSDYLTRAQTLRNHIYTMKGSAIPPFHKLPIVPLINSAVVTNGVLTINWRGSANSSAYNLQQSVTGGAWTTIATGITDLNNPYTMSVNVDLGSKFRLLPVSIDDIQSSLTPYTHAGSISKFLQTSRSIDGTPGVKQLFSANLSEIKTASGSNIFVRIQK